MRDTPYRRPGVLPAIEETARKAAFLMSCEERTGALLATLAASKPGGRVLELGTGAGAGAAWLLSGMDSSSELVSVEQDASVQAIAIEHLGQDPRAHFVCSDAMAFLDGLRSSEHFDLIFVDCRPGKFFALEKALDALAPGGLYVGDDLMPQSTWPSDHQGRVDRFLEELPLVETMQFTPMAWASGLVVGARRMSHDAGGLGLGK